MKQSQEKPLNEFEHVPIKVMAEAEELGIRIAANERAMQLLKDDNEEPRKQLLDIMEIYKIPFINIKVPTSKNHVENFSITLVTERGSIDVRVGLNKLLKRYLTKHEADEAEAIRLSRKIAKYLVPYLRVDSLLVTKLREKKWATKLIANKTTKPYVMVEEGHKSNAITSKTKV